jgi:DNA ligase (NAD+)
MEFEAARKRVDALSERIRELQDAYYRRDEVLVSDADYDALVRELEALEQEHPILSSDDSPTQAVGFGSGALFSPVTHAERMFSLDNVFSTEEMTAWLEKIQSVHPGATYLCELKVDGLALNLRYRQGGSFRRLPAAMVLRGKM